MADELIPEGSGDGSELLLYQTEDGRTRVQVRMLDETVWLNQRQLGELFQVTIPTINEHIQNIFTEGELTRDPTIRRFRIVQTEGTRSVEREVEHYNLDVIISVGYRVRSHRGTQFRQWATQRLREYVIKGFVLDDQRLKEPRGQNADYFDELLERIRDIRASEARFSQKIKDIYATSIDYDPNTSETHTFFKTVQNKLHFAVHGRTAAEIIVERVDSSKENMGLTTWKDGPKGRIKKSDVDIAKNYLSEKEIKTLNLIVDQYLSFAELQAQQRKTMTMTDWRTKLDAFLQLNDRDILQHAGKVTHDLAKEIAGKEFGKFEAKRRKLQAEQSDKEFDTAVDEIKKLPQSRKKP